MKPLVYLAGPYKNPDPVWNTNLVVKRADKFMADGIVVPFVPHLTMLWHTISPHDEQFWYALDLVTLNKCDALFRMPGKSSGADNEVAFALDNEIPVFDQEDLLYAWARGG